MEEWKKKVFLLDGIDCIKIGFTKKKHTEHPKDTRDSNHSWQIAHWYLPLVYRLMMGGRRSGCDHVWVSLQMSVR